MDAEKASAIAHLANLSYRAGSPAASKKLAKAMADRPEIPAILDGQQDQLAAWGIGQPGYTLGALVQVDPATRKVNCKGIDPAWLHTPGRDEFVVPGLA